MAPQEIAATVSKILEAAEIDFDGMKTRVLMALNDWGKERLLIVTDFTGKVKKMERLESNPFYRPP